MPNIEYAKKHLVEHGFSPYSTAYVATNEDLRTVLQYMPNGTERALTVAASGDHPMFIKLYGAKHVDTFDISFHSRLIMDIKTRALSLLNHEEYHQLLKDLYESKDIVNVKNMLKIIATLTPFEQKYIKEMGKQRLFSKPINPLTLPLPTETEFQKMQQVINKPFNFIWSDIQTLHKKITKTYDFIHLSNVFDYITTYQQCINVLNSLVPYTVPGCSICITCFSKDSEAICENFVWDQELHHDKKTSWTGAHVADMTNSAYIIHRTR